MEVAELQTLINYVVESLVFIKTPDGVFACPPQVLMGMAADCLAIETIDGNVL